MVNQEILGQLEAFKNFDSRQLAAVVPYSQEITYQRGDKLFTEGDPATEVWFVVDGHVDLRFEMPDRRPSTDETTMASVRVVDAVAKTLGWSCFVPSYKMRLSAYCVSRTCKVVRIAKENLLRFFDEDPRAGYLFMAYLIKVVGYRFHQFQDEVAKIRGELMMSGW